jgi:hypothetical protein
LSLRVKGILSVVETEYRFPSPLGAREKPPREFRNRESNRLSRYMRTYRKPEALPYEIDRTLAGFGPIGDAAEVADAFVELDDLDILVGLVGLGDISGPTDDG